MGFPTSGVNYSNTGANNTSKFIPEIWSGKLVEKFYDATVFSEIANTDYEGEIKSHGDKVLIRTVPSLVINDYTKGQSLSYQTPESPNVELAIDKGKYFAFEVKSVDKYQSDLNLMNTFADDGSEQMQIAIDTDVLSNVFGDADAANAGAAAGRKSGNINLGEGGAPLVLTKDNVLDTLVDYATVLDEQNIPSTNRWVVLPPTICGLIKKSELKDASLAGDNESIMRNGRLGMIDRFTIYSSNNLNVASGNTDVMFGHKSAITFASQITEMETIPNQNDFGELVRSLQVYGYEVIKGESLGHSVVTTTVT
jgi:hypothetical protein